MSKYLVKSKLVFDISILERETHFKHLESDDRFEGEYEMENGIS